MDLDARAARRHRSLAKHRNVRVCERHVRFLAEEVMANLRAGVVSCVGSIAYCESVPVEWEGLWHAREARSGRVGVGGTSGEKSCVYRSLCLCRAPVSAVCGSPDIMLRFVPHVWDTKRKEQTVSGGCERLCVCVWCLSLGLTGGPVFCDVMLSAVVTATVISRARAGSCWRFACSGVSLCCVAPRLGPRMELVSTSGESSVVCLVV